MLCRICPGDCEIQVPRPGARSPGFDPVLGGPVGAPAPFPGGLWLITRAPEACKPPCRASPGRSVAGRRCHLWLGAEELLAASNKLSALQIIANHHMQSISFASGGDPVSAQGPHPRVPCPVLGIGASLALSPKSRAPRSPAALSHRWCLAHRTQPSTSPMLPKTLSIKEVRLLPRVLNAGAPLGGCLGAAQCGGDGVGAP